MKIHIKSLTDAAYDIEIEPSDTIDTVKRKFQARSGIPPDQQRLIYGGKPLEDDAVCWTYGIEEGATLHLTLRLRSTESSLPSRSLSSTSAPVEAITVDRKATEQILAAWDAKAKEGNFDSDVCIVDPQAYYANLAFLETAAIEASELYHSEGLYKDALRNNVEVLLSRHGGLITDENRSLLDGYPLALGSVVGNDFDKLWNSSQDLLASLRTSYLLLCRTLATLDALQKAKFCTSYFSILLEQADANIAQIVPIPARLLVDIKAGIEVAVVQICNSDIDLDAIYACLAGCVEEPCSRILEKLQIPPFSRPRSTASILALCRNISLLLDLGLVSYTGSHAARFDLEYLHQDLGGINVSSDDDNSIWFDCRLRRLACLEGFLDSEQVWVFRCGTGRFWEGATTGQGQLSILTHLEEFADIWGPVWSVPADNKVPDVFQRHNVSKGVICRVDEKKSSKDKAIKCHWYDWNAFQRRRGNRLLADAKPLNLHKDDLLLIGTRFRDNSQCKFTLDDFQSMYGHEMGVLGSEPSSWESELDSRTGAVGITKIMGVTVSGTQKRRPMTSVKQLTLASWTHFPRTANVGVLNQYLGVEISHCTGNARRVRLKDLMVIPNVKAMLDFQFPGWSDHQWGRAFLAALRDVKTEAIFNVWTDFAAYRPQMADLVCFVLNRLDKTGRREDGFIAGFLHDNQEMSFTLDNQRNDWSILLKDSHLMATYAVITGVCIECYTPDHSTATCTSGLGYTVLCTQLGVGSEISTQTVKVHPSGATFRQLQRVDRCTLFLTASSAISNVGAHLLPNHAMATAIEIRGDGAKGGQQYTALLRSSQKSHCGMKAARERVPDNRSSSTEPARPGYSRPPDQRIPNPVLAQVPLNERMMRPGPQLREAREPPNLPLAREERIHHPQQLHYAGPHRQFDGEDDAQMHFLPFAPYNPGAYPTRARIPAYPGSIMDDVRNFDVDDEPAPRMKDLLHDINNYQFDDD